MKSLSKDQKRYLAWNLLLLAGAIAYFFYYLISLYTTVPFSHCFLREWFGIYCPLCGGTRCLWELVHLHVWSALRYNAYVVLLVLLFLLWEIATLIRFSMGKKYFFQIPKWVFILLGVLLLLFFAIRTTLLLKYGIDWIGDLP